MKIHGGRGPKIPNDVDEVLAGPAPEHTLPKVISSLEEFWGGIEVAKLDVANGKTCDARELSRTLRERHGIA